jgi:hypothetical protein
MLHVNMRRIEGLYVQAAWGLGMAGQMPDGPVLVGDTWKDSGPQSKPRIL